MVILVPGPSNGGCLLGLSACEQPDSTDGPIHHGRLCVHVTRPRLDCHQQCYRLPTLLYVITAVMLPTLHMLLTLSYVTNTTCRQHCYMSPILLYVINAIICNQQSCHQHCHMSPTLSYVTNTVMLPTLHMSLTLSYVTNTSCHQYFMSQIIHVTNTSCHQHCHMSQTLSYVTNSVMLPTLDMSLTLSYVTNTSCHQHCPM